jgi:hypothetical protein
VAVTRTSQVGAMQRGVYQLDEQHEQLIAE